MSPIETIIEKLNEAGCGPTETASGYQSRCPAHDDLQPSLSISEGSDGKVLIKCHAGCTTEKIVDSVGLKMKDLFPPQAPKTGQAKHAKGKNHVYPTLGEAAEAVRLRLGKALRSDQQIAARFIYSDASGRETFAVVRYEPEPRDGTKTFRPFHVVEGGWCMGDPEGMLPLYNRKAVTSRKDRMYVPEGEGCVDMITNIGLFGTTSAHGAKSASKTDWSLLAGRDVVILPDNDEPGGEYAVEVARILTALNPPATVRIVKLPDLPESGDIVDYRELHRDKPVEKVREMIEALADAAPVWADDVPRAEILDAAPETIRRPLCIVADRGYLTTWVHIRANGEDAVKRVVLRDDGAMFADPPVPGALPLADLGVNVDLKHVPHFDSLFRGAALKRYASGERVRPAEVFARVRAVVDHFMDFAHSLGDQNDLVDLIALYIVASYLLDAFSVIGYVWPNGDKGAGKTKLLVIVTGLGYLGVLVTAGGSFASLRDLADYGATIGFDDSETIMDVRRADPDKRTLLLAGNRKGTYVTLKEPVGDHGWTTRYVHAFCPRLFSAINLPDETLASRTIVVPLVRSADNTKANRDPADHDMWPLERRRLIDDLWALGLANLTTLRAYDRRIPERVPLVGRVLEPWRAVLAVALWLQEKHGVAGVFDRMTALAERYQEERGDIEETSPVRLLILALRRMLETAEASSMDATPTDIAASMNQIAVEDDIDHPGETFTNARKVGRLLQRLRMARAERTAGAKRWRVSADGLDALARAYGMGDQCRSAVSAVDAVSRGTPPTGDDNGTASETGADVCHDAVCAVSAVDAVSRGTPPVERHTASEQPIGGAVSATDAANDLDWEGA